MERAPLRPLPAQPPAPLEPDEALRRVRTRLPELDATAAAALATVALAGRPRAHVAAAQGVTDAELGAILARARKALRRDLVALAGSGWCERAERTISDRMDGVAAARDARVLDAHLRCCDRCAEHERRLVQAQDALIAQPTVAPERAPAGPAPDLHVVPAPAAQPAGDREPSRPGNEAAAAAVLPLRRAAAGVAWNLATVLAVALALLAAAVAVAGTLGASVSF